MCTVFFVSHIGFMHPSRQSLLFWGCYHTYFTVALRDLWWLPAFLYLECSPILRTLFGRSDVDFLHLPVRIIAESTVFGSLNILCSLGLVDADIWWDPAPAETFRSSIAPRSGLMDDGPHIKRSCEVVSPAIWTVHYCRNHFSCH